MVAVADATPAAGTRDPPVGERILFPLKVETTRMLSIGCEPRRLLAGVSARFKWAPGYTRSISGDSLLIVGRLRRAQSRAM
jgi:hypothetical protein